ncbi:MAG: hypothetical protein IJE04_02990 [Bacilli bacterium]|nr:hypothetical protein [Bacilli bacterium]
MNNLDNIVDINTPKLLYDKDIIKIGENAKISIGTYEKRRDVFYDVILELNEKEIFLGRFLKDEKTLTVKYNNGKILIGYEEFKKEVEEMRIIKVLTLYEMVDDTFYSCSEKDALNIFNSNLSDAYLKDKETLMYRADVEKRKRLIKREY